MRHRVAGKKLNADTQHRLAMRRNLSRSLFLHGRIVTTLAKAKATRRFTEKLITRARHALAAKAAGDVHGWIHQVRLLARDVKDRDVLRKLLTEVAPRANRPGGYTRIVRDWKNQVGDNAPRERFRSGSGMRRPEPHVSMESVEWPGRYGSITTSSSGERTCFLPKLEPTARLRVSWN